MKNGAVECGSWFDHPEWFEIGFQDVTGREADFFEAAFQRWCDFPVRRLLEPACGSGRLVVEMARRGYEVTGFDLSKPSVEFLRRRLKGTKLKAKAMQADMTRFSLPQKFDGAFCTYNSFRVLTTETAAQSHLKCVAKALRKGGLYFLGLHLAPPGVDPMGIERWTGERGRTHVTTTLRVTGADTKRRVERLRISLLVREYGESANERQKKNGRAKPPVIKRLRDEFDYRLYTAAQMRQLLRSIPQFELIDVFDFWYQIDEPQKLDNELYDALFVLRRR
jgi:SAM-dependent methyltransferase